MAEQGIRRRGIAPQQEAGGDHAEETGIAMHRDRADRVVDLEAPLDPVVQLVDDDDDDRRDQHRLDRMVEVVAGRAAMTPASPPEKVQ